jgi:hypothetical protein
LIAVLKGKYRDTYKNKPAQQHDRSIRVQQNGQPNTQRLSQIVELSGHEKETMGGKSRKQSRLIRYRLTNGRSIIRANSINKSS